MPKEKLSLGTRISRRHPDARRAVVEKVGGTASCYIAKMFDELQLQRSQPETNINMAPDKAYSWWKRVIYVSRVNNFRGAIWISHGY